MHWSLDQVRELEIDEWVELVSWLKEKKNSEEEGIDADDIVAAKQAADKKRDNGG